MKSLKQVLLYSLVINPGAGLIESMREALHELAWIPRNALWCRVVVNRGQAVIEAVREARYLDRLGFVVPEVALHAALQASHFRAAAEGLTNMLASYYKVCHS